MANQPECVGRSQPFVKIQPPPIIAQRAPASTDTAYPKGATWLDESQSPAVLYDHLGGGSWQSNNLTLSTDDTFAAASDSTASSSLAIKTYVDGVAIAGAPVATEVTAGIGELATDAEAVAGTPSTALVAYLVTPSNFAAVFAAPPAMGGTTAAAGTFTDLTADGTGTVSLGANAASDFTITGAFDLTLATTLGSLVVNAGEAAADAIDLNAASGGFDVDVALLASITSTRNNAQAILLESTAGGIDILASGSGGAGEDIDIICTGGSVNISGTENAADAVTIAAANGGIDITCGGAAGEDIDLVNTAGSIHLNAGEAVSDAINIDSSGGVDVDAAGVINLGSSANGASAIVLDASAGGVDILASNASAGEDINITATGSSVNVSSTENAALAIYLHADGGTSETIRLRSDQGTGVASIDVLSDVGGITLTAGLNTSDAINIVTSNAAGGIDIDAGTAGFIVDTTGGISLDSAAASNFTATGAFDITFQSTLGSILINAGEAAADAINIDAGSGGLDVDVALQMNLTSSQAAAADSIRINASAADGGIDIDCGTGGATLDSTGAISIDGAATSNFTVTGAAADATVQSVGGSVNILASEAAANAIRLNASDAAGGIDVDCGSGGFLVDAASGAISLDSALASNFTVTGAADLTLNSTAGAVNITSGETNADSVVITSAGGLDLAVTGAAGKDIDVTCTSGSMNVTVGENVSDALVVNCSGAASGISIDCGTAGVTIGTGILHAITSVASAATPYAVLGTDYVISTDTTGGILTITLPAAPATGRTLVIYDGTGQAAIGGNITIDGNGKNIAAAGTSAGTKLINTAYESYTLYYNGTLWLGQNVV